MSEAGFRLDLKATGVACLTLDRPELHNAFDERLIAGLTAAFADLDRREEVRVIVLAAAGRSFSAGADLNWMRRMAEYSYNENLADANALAGLLHAINTVSKPTLALVQGAAYGGGVGLVACCDVAIGTEAARFCLSEVKLGLIPAAISPYVIAAIGARAARRWFLTAEAFSAAEALRLGLLHAVVPAAELEAAGAAVIEALLQAGPEAVAAAKALISAVAGRPLDQCLRAETAERIARVRAGAEGREGVAAFLEKRRPGWAGD